MRSLFAGSISTIRLREGGIRMREILFRGKAHDGSGWAFGSLTRTMAADTELYSILRGNGNYATPVMSETIGQYLGLEDDTGCRIFEGDIVQCDDIRVVVRFGECGGVWNQEGCYGYMGFMFVGIGDEDGQIISLRTDPLYWLRKYPCIVIGNEHDNPKLLEV